MKETPFYNFLVSKYTNPDNDGLVLSAASAKTLDAELDKHCSHITIHGREIFVCRLWGDYCVERFYTMGNLSKGQVYLYPDEKKYSMIELDDKKNLPAVAFEKMIARFTNGQAILLHVLNERLAKRETFTIDDARYVFCKAKKRGIQTFCRYVDGKYVNVQYANGLEVIKVQPDYYDYTIKQWMKNNLGALMMKGALVAIPVIQLGNDALIGID